MGATIKFKSKKTGKFDKLSDINLEIAKLWNVELIKDSFVKPKTIEKIREENPDFTNFKIKWEFNTQSTWFDNLYMLTQDKTIEDLKNDYLKHFEKFTKFEDYGEIVLKSQKMKLYEFIQKNYDFVTTK